MEAVLQSFFAGIPILLVHLGVTIGMLIVAVAIYIWITPYPEFRLIKDGNNAAAISLAGAILGLALPLAFAMAASINVIDILIWGIVTLLLQLAVFRFTDLVLRDLPARIEAGETGPALLLAAIKLAVGMINAAAVSG